jgi:hypothetical protein
MNLFTKYKKIFLVVGFLGITVFLGFLLYKTFFASTLTIAPEAGVISTSTGGLQSAETGTGQIVTSTGAGTITGSENITAGTEGTKTTEGSQPNLNNPTNIALGGITKVEVLTTSPGLGATLASNGGVQYYNKDDGYFYKIDKDGNAVKMSDRVFHDVSAVTWSPSKDKAILEYPDKSKILYNFTTKKQVTFPSHWEDFSFSPQSNQIIAKSIALDPDNRYLVTSSEDGSKVVNVEEIGTNATVQTSWSPNNQIVATYTKSIDFNRQEVFFVGLNGENFKSTTVEGRGLTYEWSKTGDRLLYSAYNANSDMKPLLWIVDAQGDTINQNRQSLGINTWADKCTFASNTEVYCAVPVNLEKGAGLVPALANKTSDELYKIDLTTGAKKLIATPDGSYNVSSIIVDDAQSQLTFSDRNTGLLYKVKLK